jgi:PAS domain S-box-containing protein
LALEGVVYIMASARDEWLRLPYDGIVESLTRHRLTMQDEPGKHSARSESASIYTLQEVEQHFTELVSNVEDHAIFLLNPDGIVISWNAGAQRIKGYRAAEIIGQPFTRFYPQEANDRGWPQEELRRATAIGRFEDEGWRVRSDGSLFWANVVITALRTNQGQLRGFLKITRDLTERRQAEEQVRQSEERLRLMIESVKDYAIFMLDPDGRVATWNAGAERINGYTADEIIGKHFSVFFTSEDLAEGKPARELHVAATTGRFEDEGWRVRSDRSHFWANVVITAVRDKQDTLRGYVKITRDMTERRQAEALRVADRQKNEFLAMLAHELRNPLAPIRNGVQLLKILKDEAAIHETTEMMERQVLQLVRLVDDLLDISRIITGKIHLEKEPVEVSAFINRAIEEVQPALDAGGHELMLAMPARPMMVDGDVVRLSQVISNLLNNAAKFTEKPSQISLSVERTEDEVMIRVRDRGVGMTPDVLSRIFHLFVQGDTSLARHRGGLGIGLALARRLIELHGGTVEASSQGLSQGSEFVVRLPVSSATHSPSKPGMYTPSSLPKQAGRRILVVDDNVDAAVSVVKLLKLWGHEVQTAFSGQEALEMARKFRPQIVLLDIGMPGMSGYEVARQLRAQPEFQSMVITALTGYGQAEDRRRSQEAGFNHHLTKPPDPFALAELLTSPESFGNTLGSN